MNLVVTAQYYTRVLAESLYYSAKIDMPSVRKNYR